MTSTTYETIYFENQGKFARHDVPSLKLVSYGFYVRRTYAKHRDAKHSKRFKYFHYLKKSSILETLRSTMKDIYNLFFMVIVPSLSKNNLSPLANYIYATQGAKMSDIISTYIRIFYNSITLTDIFPLRYSRLTGGSRPIEVMHGFYYAS